MSLEVEWAGTPSMAPADQNLTAQAKWKPNPVAIYLPPETPATKVCDPLGRYVLCIGMFLICTLHCWEPKGTMISVLT